MKKLLIGLTLLGSFSTFANENINRLKAEFAEAYTKVSTGEVQVDYDVDDIHQCVVHGREGVTDFSAIGFFKTRLVAHRGGANLSCTQIGPVCTKRNKKDQCVKKEQGMINACAQSLSGYAKNIVGNALSEYMLFDYDKNIFRAEVVQSYADFEAEPGQRYSSFTGRETIVIGVKTTKDDAMTFEISAKWLHSTHFSNFSGYVSGITKSPILAYVKCYNTGASLKDSNPSVKK